MTITINSFEELDNFLNYVEALNDDDAMRKHWLTLKLNPLIFKDFAEKIKKLDPFTDQYYSLIQDFFGYLQGCKYHISNEGLLIDVELMTHVGYPYSTRSPATVGAFLIAYGFIIKTMNVPIPARILDIGTGVGALTQHLAKMGYDLTCVDVNDDFLEVIRRASKGLPNRVDCVLSNMEELDLKQKFDAVLFMESFHHSLNHRETLKKAINHLKPNGIIVFAAEPIIKSETDYLPYPWGPRLDGESIRAIRKHGWIELGFPKVTFMKCCTNQDYKPKDLALPKPIGRMLSLHGPIKA
ncbi:MAG: class I SAM-dependent methyltransferase [Candidatus Competibacteraceae bacterium]|nr:class I SAM-dependent methyltransferase [Candidatus Competibacteraceae bacterium]